MRRDTWRAERAARDCRRQGEIAGSHAGSRFSFVAPAPSEVPESGSAFDLPIAVSILASTGQMRSVERLDRFGPVGELSLDGAHSGVLFPDGLPEFLRKVLEQLRQPLEDARVTLSWAAVSLTDPSRFMPVAAMNPCPCGYHGDGQRRCACEPSEAIRERVARTRETQRARFAGRAEIHANAHMTARDLHEFCRVGEGSDALLRTVIVKLGLSARAYHRVLKIARTVADLAGSAEIGTAHVSEAIQYRSLDRLVKG